jgi:short-subunit dehydrogenase
MDLELTGRRAVVTGGSRGIGKAIARALAAEGCDVGLVARDAAVTEATAVELAGESGRRVMALAADTGSDAAVEAMAAPSTTDTNGDRGGSAIVWDIGGPFHETRGEPISPSRAG